MGVDTSLWPSNTRSLMSLTASQMAAASAASFLPRLPERRLGGEELGRHQAHGVAEPLEFASPVVGARARFHTNETWWQRGDEFEQLGTLRAGTQKYRFACGINAMHSKDILCQIDSDGDNVSHGLPLPTSEEVDERSNFPSWHLDALSRNCAAHSGRGSPFHSLENLMQLIKFTPTGGEDGENIYTDEVVMISDDPDMLRAKAHELCQGMGIKPESWCSRYPVMGNDEVQSDHEWVMKLFNGIGFIIEL